MSTLKKLHIQGIRSFDPKEGRMIEFFTPITLIIGQNGCGKTTIIEALKFAITNSPPPGTDGGKYFINDPKLSNGYEVIGLVKLEVESVFGQRVQCTRRIKATLQAKTKAIKFQTLEATFRTQGKDGTWKDMSSKCLDSKLVMTQNVGVSEAILNYVILCHQEDSCWPLDEAKKVKERFDAIFNTTGYMESLKKLEIKDKELGQKVKQETGALGYADQNMKIFTAKTREKEEHLIKLNAMTDTENKMEEERLKLLEKLEALAKIEEEFAKHKGEVEGLRARVEEQKRGIAELRGSIKEEFQGDIEELENRIEEFHAVVSEKKREVKKRNQDLTSKDKELSALQKQMQEYLLQEGKFRKSESDNIERLSKIQKVAKEVHELLKQIKETSQDANSSSFAVGSAIENFFQSFEDDSDSITPDVILKAITAAIRCKSLEHNKTKAALGEKEDELQRSIDQLRTNEASLKKEVDMKKDQIIENKQTFADLKKRLREIEGSNEKIALLDEKEQEVIERIEKIEKSGVIAKYETEIATINQKLKDFEATLNATAKKVALLSKDKEKTDRIAIFNKQKAQKRTDCNEILRRTEDKLKSVLGSPPKENLGAALEKKIKLLKSESLEKQKAQQVKEREISKLEAELKHMDRELKKKEETIEDWKNQTADLLEEGDFHEKYKQLKEELDGAQKNSYFGEAAVWLNKKFIQQMSKKPCCPICKRNFTGNDLNNVTKSIEKKVEDMQKSHPDLKQQVDELKKKYQTYVDLKPSWDENSKIEEEEIPSLRKTKAELEKKIQVCKEELEDLSDAFDVLSIDLSDAQDLTKDVTLYDENVKEIKKLEDSVKRLESERDPAAVACTDTLADVQAECESLASSISTKRQEKDMKDDLKTRKNKELLDFRTEKNRIQQEKLQITSEMQNREALENQKREIEESIKVFQEAIAELNRKIPILRTEIETAQRAKSAFVKEKDATLQAILSDKEGLQHQYRRLSELKEQAEKFEAEKQKFATTQKLIDEAKKQIESLSAGIASLRKNIDQLNKDVAEQEVSERDLGDNLKLKLKLKEVEDLKAKLAKKEEHLKDAELSGGVMNQKHKLSGEYQKVSAKINENKGRIGELKKTIQGITRELSTDYKNAEEDFIKRLATKTVLERAQVDIRRYKKALDHAILTFHKKRMETINKSLKKYWQQVYKGNDIDYIQIRTEDDGKEDKKTIELKSTRKSYSYRVVMIRRGIEIDMRGRCSAGQKVLASTIVRIALAEAFSSKCGIIALDEPTTNLDEANINALADCLSLIARRMALTKTFQLIIITHDQPFMERLIDIDSIEYYYRVKRDANGYSQILQVAK